MMRKSRLQILGLVLIGVVLFTFPVFAEKMDKEVIPLPLLEKIEILPKDETIQLDMHFNQDIEYSSRVFSNPKRIVIDIKGGWYRNYFTQLKVEDWLLSGVRIFHNRYGLRLIIELKYDEAQYDFHWDKESKVLKMVFNRLFTAVETTQVAKGVKFHAIKRGLRKGYIVAQALEIEVEPNYLPGRQILEEIGRYNPNQDVKLKVGFKNGPLQGLVKVSELVQQEGALAGVNGNFFAVDGHPLGLLIQDGRLVSEPLYNRTAWGIDQRGVMHIDNVSLQGEVVINGTAFPLAGFNRPRGAGELVVYLSTYGERTGTNQWGQEAVVFGGIVQAINPGNSAIPRGGWVLSAHGENKALVGSLKVGDEVKLSLHTTPDWIGQGVVQAIGGGPRLVADGQIKISGREENFQLDILKGRAPRTALGITPDNRLLLVTVDGRSKKSSGVTLEELAELLIYLGATDAMNLDGGKSSTMVIKEQILNTPSNGSEIKVHNGLLIFAEPLEQ